MTNLKKSENNTDYNKLIAHIHSPKALVVDVITKIPWKFHLAFPEGDIKSQVENITNFVLNNFKTVTPNEILLAYEYNAAHKFEKHIELYGKIDLQTLGSVLNAYKKWRSDNLPKGQHTTPDVNLEFELTLDLNNVKNSGGKFRPSKYVEEKFFWLETNREDFDAKIDQAKVKEHTKYYQDKLDRGELAAYSKYVKPEVFGMSKYKAEKIAEYLLKYVR